MDQDQFHQFTPLLETKVANSYMAGARSGAVMVDNLDNRVVIFPNWGRTLDRKAKVGEDHAQVANDLAGCIGGNQLGLRNVLGCDRLRLGSVRNGTASHGGGVAGGGSHLEWTVTKASVDICARFEVGGRKWNNRESGVGDNQTEGNPG